MWNVQDTEKIPVVLERKKAMGLSIMKVYMAMNFSSISTLNISICPFTSDLGIITTQLEL